MTTRRSLTAVHRAAHPARHVSSRTRRPAARVLASVAVVSSLFLAACGDDESDGDGAASGGDADLQLVSSDLGDVLADASGKVLYLFVPDAQGESTCYDQCAANWPAFGEIDAVGSGLDASLLGTTTRTDGTVQATYNGWPLYYYAGDANPGDMLGQSLNDVWWVVDAAGEAVSS
ncbi:MAG: hypothetical protein KDB40_13085 [Acidimicrobiales bacterium]|nr:hypothetical protein [Acidimicrobiales bacterium]MCB9393121.1 hypothetical protein [Acidimicrobiaceae bacterium]